MKNAIVGQSGGPTAAINATLAGVIKGVAKAHQSQIINHLYGMKNGLEGLTSEQFELLDGLFEDSASLDLLTTTPAAALGSCRLKLPKDLSDPLYDRIFAILEKMDIGYLFYIGGNDSMDTTVKLSKAAKERQFPLSVIGIPKTIDCDLCGTDHTPGYGSAAKYIAVTMSEIWRDTAVYTKPAVTIVEIMGRDAGWLTAAAGLSTYLTGTGADYLYLPEVTFSMDKFLDDVREALKKHPNVVIAVSEGIKFADGQYVGASAQSGAKDAFGHAYLSGTSKVLENAVKEAIGCKVRSIELNLPQRCAAHLLSKTDIEESLAIGQAAVSSALAGHSGEMMVFSRVEGEGYRVDIHSVSVDTAANHVRVVPPHFISPQGNNVTDECLAYIAPLIQGEWPIVYQNGIPLHFHF